VEVAGKKPAAARGVAAQRMPAHSLPHLQEHSSCSTSRSPQDHASFAQHGCHMSPGMCRSLSFKVKFIECCCLFRQHIILMHNACLDLSRPRSPPFRRKIGRAQGLPHCSSQDWCTPGGKFHGRKGTLQGQYPHSCNLPRSILRYLYEHCKYWSSSCAA
jgi:hypothetical protein